MHITESYNRSQSSTVHNKTKELPWLSGNNVVILSFHPFDFSGAKRYRQQEFNLNALSGFVPVRAERSVNRTMLELVHGQSCDGLPANRWRLRYYYLVA